MSGIQGIQNGFGQRFFRVQPVQKLPHAFDKSGIIRTVKSACRADACLPASICPLVGSDMQLHHKTVPVIHPARFRQESAAVTVDFRGIQGFPRRCLGEYCLYLLRGVVLPGKVLNPVVTDHASRLPEEFQPALQGSHHFPEAPHRHARRIGETLHVLCKTRLLCVKSLIRTKRRNDADAFRTLLLHFSVINQRVRGVLRGAGQLYPAHLHAIERRHMAFYDFLFTPAVYFRRVITVKRFFYIKITF